MEELSTEKHVGLSKKRDLTQVELITKRPIEDERRIPFDTAEPPPEVIRVIQEQGLSQNKIEGWVAVPAINPPLERISRRKIETRGRVDAVQLLESLLNEPVLEGTLRTIDVLNGCGHHCDTCLADAALPSKMFTVESLDRLFSDERFLNMLQFDSLRIGSSGDILDHPQASEIIKMMLEKTTSIDRKNLSKEGKHHKIKIFTNYRPNLERQLDELIQMAQENPDRIRLTISLPFNRKDTVNKAFVEYAQEREGLIGKHNIDDQGNFKGRISFGEKAGLKNIGIQDVRHPMVLFMTGRILSDEVNAGRVPEWDKVEVDRETSFEDRGFSKTYLNADALWLMVYATPYESHTGRVFTPLSPDNVKAFSHLPYHSDFPTPSNWPGGKAMSMSHQEARRLRSEMANSGKPMKNTVVVG